MATKTNANGQSLDITTMSEEQIQAYLDQKKVEAKKKLAQRGKDIRKQLEDYCLQQFGLSLKDIYRSDKTRTFKHPKTGVEYVYAGFGKLPEWLKGPDNKPIASYEVTN